MPTPRIIVTGAGGRLGAALVREWKSVGMEVIGFARQELDLAQPEQMRATLDPLDFAVLVNCAAQTNVDRCETEPAEAMQINSQAVRTLAEICKEYLRGRFRIAFAKQSAADMETRAATQL